MGESNAEQGLQVANHGTPTTIVKLAAATQLLVRLLGNLSLPSIELFSRPVESTWSSSFDMMRLVGTLHLVMQLAH